jgi:rubredoxin
LIEDKAPNGQYKCLVCGKRFEAAPGPVKCPNDPGMIINDESTDFVPERYPTHHQIKWINYLALVHRKNMMLAAAMKHIKKTGKKATKMLR